MHELRHKLPSWPVLPNQLAELCVFLVGPGLLGDRGVQLVEPPLPALLANAASAVPAACWSARTRQHGDQQCPAPCVGGKAARERSAAANAAFEQRNVMEPSPQHQTQPSTSAPRAYAPRPPSPPRPLRAGGLWPAERLIAKSVEARRVAGRGRRLQVRCPCPTDRRSAARDFRGSPPGRNAASAQRRDLLLTEFLLRFQTIVGCPIPCIF